MSSPHRSLHLALPGVLALMCSALGCGGAAHSAANGKPTGLGVQSNADQSEVTLRMQPDGPIAFATQLRVTLRSEMLGTPMDADMETRGVRRVLEQREDGSLAIEEIDTQSTFSLSMMGRSRTSSEEMGPPEVRRYVLGDRGGRIDEGAPSATPAPHARVRSVERAMEPLVRALEFPAERVSPGSEWGAQGIIPMSELDPELSGEARFQFVQRLERFEGTGDERVAVISFQGVLEGEGESAPLAAGGPPPGVAPGPHAMPPIPGQPMPGDPGQPMPGDPGQPMPGQPMPGQPMPGDPPMMAEAVRGRIHFRGFYVVALADGFARTARAEFVGEAAMGPGALLHLPLAGELEWTASPIDAALPLAPTASASAAIEPVRD